MGKKKANKREHLSRDEARRQWKEREGRRKEDEREAKAQGMDLVSYRQARRKQTKNNVQAKLHEKCADATLPELRAMRRNVSGRFPTAQRNIIDLYIKVLQ